MYMLENLKRLLLRRSSIIALSIAVLIVFGLRLPAVLCSTLLFAGSYLVDPENVKS